MTACTPCTMSFMAHLQSIKLQVQAARQSLLQITDVGRHTRGKHQCCSSDCTYNIQLSISCRPVAQVRIITAHQTAHTRYNRLCHSVQLHRGAPGTGRGRFGADRARALPPAAHARHSGAPHELVNVPCSQAGASVEPTTICTPGAGAPVGASAGVAGAVCRRVVARGAVQIRSGRRRGSGNSGSSGRSGGGADAALSWPCLCWLRGWR